MRKAEQILEILKKVIVTNEDLLMTQKLLGKTFMDVYQEPEPETWVSVYRPTPTSGNRTKVCFIALKSPDFFRKSERTELAKILEKAQQEDFDKDQAAFAQATHIDPEEQARFNQLPEETLYEKMG